MRWEDFRRSDNVEDVRGEGGFGGGGGFPIPGGGGGLGIGTIIVLGLIGWALGIDPRILIGGAEIFPRSRPDAGAAARRRRAKSRRADRPAGRFRRRRARLDRRRVERHLPRQWPDLPAAAAAALFRPDRRRRLRHGAIGDGAVLLPAGQARLSRHRLLPRDGAEVPRLQRQAMRIRAGLRDRA